MGAVSLRRRLQRAGRRLLGRPAPYPLFFSPDYAFSLPTTPLDPLRAEKVVVCLEREGLTAPPLVRRPRPASVKQLLRVHNDAYLEALPRAEVLLPALGMEIGTRQGRRALAVQRLMTGGTIAAAHHAVEHRTVAINLGGGFHHALAGRGQGFCLLNDVAVAIQELRATGFRGRVAVVDLDLHDGDGTRHLFAEDPAVHTYSVHNRHWGDPEAVASTSLELGSEVGDDEYLGAVRSTLPPVLAAHRPELVVYLAGTDPAADDALGDWRVSADGMYERDRLVCELVRETAGCPALVVVLAGGYGNETWRYTARFLADLFHGRRLEPPATEEVLLDRYQARARLFTRAELAGEVAGDDWGLTAEDLLGSAAMAPSRFLGFYTEQGLELALERNGVLDRLRDLGYRHPTLEVDLSQPTGHTLRLWGEPERRHLLAETRLRRDRHLLADHELLVIEWLLLQNPRARFAPQRPPLPGQKHPGLGLLADAIALLILICRRLDLDGLWFVPSHYHLAAKGRAYLRFLDPGDAGLLRSLEEVLDEVPLIEATRLVEEGHVIDAATGEPFAWRRMPMVLPVSERLSARFDADYERRTAEAAARRRFAIRKSSGA